MITLQINTQTEVNQNQYNFIKAKFSWAIAYRKDGDKFFIKPLLFYGYKTLIEKYLNQLK